MALASALALLALLAGAARPASVPAVPGVPSGPARASAVPLCRPGADCRQTPSTPQELFYEVNGEQVIIAYQEEKYFLVWCDSSMFPSTLAASDEPALPALPALATVDHVEFRGCRLPRGSYAAAMAALNVTTVKMLELTVPDADSVLVRRHLADLSVRSLVINAKNLETERDFLDYMTGLEALQLFGVRLNADALQSLPVSLTKLNLNDALGTAPYGSLQWMERLHSLRALTLMEKGATGAPLVPPSFALFPNLTDVILQVPLTVPPRWLDGSSLKTLSLNSCELNDLPGDMFHGVNLTSLNLSRNNLSSLPPQLISSQRWLRELDVSGAGLRGAALTRLVGSLERLERLRANDNPLGSLCDDKGYAVKTRSLLPRSLHLLQLRATNATRVCTDWVEEDSALAHIDLSVNKIDTLGYGSLEMWRTPSRLRAGAVELLLARNPLRDVEVTARDVAACRAARAASDRNLITRVPVRLTLSALSCDCSNSRLRELLGACPLLQLAEDVQCAPTPLAAPSTLLAYQPDQLLCACPTNYNFTAPGCSCGKRLRDSATVVNCTRAVPNGTRWPPADASQPLALYVTGAGLTAVPRTALVELYAANNSINALNAEDINDTLMELDLRNNSIAHVSEEAARRLGTAGPGGAPRRIWLSGNSLACECTDRAAIERLKSAKVQAQVQDWKELRCKDGRELSALIPSELCPNPLLLALAGVAGVVLVLALLTPSLLRWARPRLKQFLFDRQLCLSWVLHTEDAVDDPSKTHDVFISYAYADRKLATKLLRWLEERGYSTVEHSRDWQAGVPVAEHIANSVLCARRTLLLVTDSFATSSWGLQEFHAAHAHALERGSARVVPVRCSLSAPNALPEDLRLYLHNNTYLSWDDPDFWDKLLRVMPPLRTKVATPALPVDKEPPLAEQITQATHNEPAPAAC